MNLSIGIIGLPNIGKSTLFNALTSKSVPVENYPFTTIDPNVGIVEVKDQRLNRIALAEGSRSKTNATIKFIDIAGLVKGASKGEGLGNKFLSEIREVSAILLLLRGFKDENISHNYKTIDPKRDKEIIEAELKLKDIETLEKRISALEPKARSNKELQATLNDLKNLLKHLNEDKLASTFRRETEDQPDEELSLLTDKPILYCINESQEKITEEQRKLCLQNLGIDSESKLMLLDVKLEEEISKLDAEEQEEFLKDLGLEENSLDRLIKASFNLLDLITFFTANKNEARATTLYKESSIIDAAASIHTDFAENFIAADVIDWESFVRHKGWIKSRESGKARLEGRDYIVNDGEVIFFKFNK